jgi:CSLREA domain-containing protein
MPYCSSRTSLSALLAAFLLSLAPLFGNETRAQIVFTVNTAFDNADLSPGDGDCRTVSNGCSLRAALQEANSTPGDEEVRIEFDILWGPTTPSESGPSWVIQPASALPTVTRSHVTIDGTTQPDAQCGYLVDGVAHTLRVELDGSVVPSSTSGLAIASDDVEVRGLTIGGFPSYGITSTGDSTRLHCSYVGITSDGSTAAPNGVGVYAEGAAFAIGGSGFGLGNVISGNSGYGVRIRVTGGAVINGNLIGTDDTGDSAVANGAGILVDTRDVTIGGTSPWDGNLISGNNGVGIDVFPDAVNTFIAGNVIGTDLAGSAPLSNNRGINVYGDSTTVGVVGAGNVICASNFYGIITFGQAEATVIKANIVGLNESTTIAIPNKYGIYASGDDIQIGGAEPGAANIVSRNTRYGVEVTSTGSVTVAHNVIRDNGIQGVKVNVYGGGWVDLRRNAIADNGELGINLCPDPTCDVVTLNDFGDADGVQNYPVLDPIYNDGSPVVLVGFSLNSTPNTDFRIELYRSSISDPSGFGEGETFLMEINLSTDASGNTTYLAPHDSGLFPVGYYVTGTATNAVGQTSEFSAAVLVDGPSVALDATVMLQGPFAGPGMSTQLNSGGILPLAQPYDIEPWEYAGFEQVTSFTPSVVDWVLVRLFSGNPAVPPMTLVASRAAFLRNDGVIVDLDGVSNLSFYAPPANYRIAVYHRNHLPIISSIAVALSETPTAYDFATALTQAYSDGGPPLTEVDDGVYGMFACDSNADGAVQALDFNEYIVSTAAGASGYVSDDCNLDGVVQALDFNLYLANTLAGASSQLP